MKLLTKILIATILIIFFGELSLIVRSNYGEVPFHLVCIISAAFITYFWFEKELRREKKS